MRTKKRREMKKWSYLNVCNDYYYVLFIAASSKHSESLGAAFFLQGMQFFC